MITPIPFEVDRVEEKDSSKFLDNLQAKYSSTPEEIMKRSKLAEKSKERVKQFSVQSQDSFALYAHGIKCVKEAKRLDRPEKTPSKKRKKSAFVNNINEVAEFMDLNYVTLIWCVTGFMLFDYLL
jgi:hypothetical protein